LLPAPIKEVGKQTLSIRLHPEVIAKIEVNIVEEKHKA
jgi:ribosomal protein L9